MGCFGTREKRAEPAPEQASIRKLSVLDADAVLRASKLGISTKAVDTMMWAYFADTSLLQHFALVAPEILLLPWEHMRKMGVLHRRDPRECDYTFVSHQWETVGHPFPDLVQLTEHIHLVRTKLIWIDWYCTPQWSRTGSDSPDDTSSAVPELIFQQAMASFAPLCFNADRSLVILKRRPGGLTLGTELLHAGIGSEAMRVDAALRSKREPKVGLALLSAVRRLDSLGLDLEYCVRAWCSLERCYLPDALSNDVRDVRLVRLEKILKMIREISEAASRLLPANESRHGADALAALLGHLKRVENIIALCGSTDVSRQFYQNAWCYHFLKRYVLRISNPNDYQVLDPLFVTNTSLGHSNGLMYLQAVAGARLDEWRDPSLCLGSGSAPPPQGVSPLMILTGSSTKASSNTRRLGNSRSAAVAPEPSTITERNSGFFRSSQRLSATLRSSRSEQAQLHQEPSESAEQEEKRVAFFSQGKPLELRRA